VLAVITFSNTFGCVRGDRWIFLWIFPYIFSGVVGSDPAS